MADVLKLLGIWFIFCVIGCLINMMRTMLSWNTCGRDQNADPCYFGFDVAGNIINLLICLACLYFIYQAATKNSMRMN